MKNLIIVGLTIFLASCAMMEEEETVLISDQEEAILEVEEDTVTFPDVEEDVDEETSVVDEYTDDSYGNVEESEDDDVDFSQFDDVDEKLTEGGGVIDLPEKEDPRSKGMKTMVRDCHVRDRPSSRSKSLNVLKKNKELWVEPAEKMGWYTVYMKRRLAFMHKICFGE